MLYRAAMTPKLFFALAALFLGATVAQDSYRLPLEAVPLAYDVSLVPYLDSEGDRAFTFDGVVVITVQAKQAVPKITLHVTDLNIQDITVMDNLQVVGLSLDEEREFLTIHLSEALIVDALYEITIRYQGILREDLSGFYRVSYHNSAGNTIWLATTVFKPTYARRAFPCFDEPALKATFVIRIAPPDGLHAVSNMPVQSITGRDPNTENRFWYNFQRSVVMSTYLVTFVVSDFGFLENRQHRVLGRVESIGNASYALSISPIILEVMANITGIEYYLPKMDLLALPGFPGATESLGLVTFPESYLFANEDEFSRLVTVRIMAHEYSHQWFGNLVTPAWWAYIWHNEGFASFFECFAADKVEPELDLLSYFVTDMQIPTLRFDSTSDTRPVISQVNTPQEILLAFGMITYWKGGCLVKMMYHFLSEPTFFKGLNIYLNNMSYAAAETDDLFNALQEAAVQHDALPLDLTVKTIMDTWTLQKGYPLITVTRDYPAGTATVTQQRFFSDGGEGEESWWVPISYTTRGEKDFNRTVPRAWLAPGSSLTLEGLAADDWLILNIQANAFYRVDYDSHNWDLLCEALEKPNFDGIHFLNQVQLADDSSELANAGLLPTAQALRALSALRNPPASAVKHTILRHVAQPSGRIANSDHLPAFQVY